jgi:hypothetical protein
VKSLIMIFVLVLHTSSFIHLWDVSHQGIAVKEPLVDEHSFNTSAEFILNYITCQIIECNALSRFAQCYVRRRIDFDKEASIFSCFSRNFCSKLTAFHIKSQF